MAKLHEVVNFIDSFLTIERFAEDKSLNGLQVEAGSQEVNRVCVAVDAGEIVIEEALARGAQLLIVHHGLFWGGALPIRGSLGRKIRRLFSAGCSLYAAHLPLDSHLEVGNAAVLAREFGLRDITPAFPYGSIFVGVTGQFDEPQTVQKLAGACRKLTGAKEPLVLPFGEGDSVKTAGIVTGSGAFGLELSHRLKLDLFISGEPKHEVYHLCRDERINGIFAGHYATETVGVRALGDKIGDIFNVSVEFIDHPSGI